MDYTFIKLLLYLSLMRFFFSSDIINEFEKYSLHLYLTIYIEENFISIYLLIYKFKIILIIIFLLISFYLYIKNK